MSEEIKTVFPVGRTWFLKNDYHSKEELTITGTAEKDDLSLELQCHDHNYTVIVDLDTSTAIQIATELFGRVGMADALLDSLIRHAVSLLREQDPEALKRFMAQLGEKVADE